MNKLALVDLAGGRCWRCGYRACLEALDLHHVDPQKKRFNLNNSATRSLRKRMEEVAGCMLLCANCHRELRASEGSAPWLRASFQGLKRPSPE